MNTILAKRINRMAQEDQEMRGSHKKGAMLDVGLDEKHAAELKNIIKRFGWPTASLVGKKASSNAWLLVQHADHDQEFQEAVLTLLRRVDRESHDINRANIAYLTDRLLIKKKKKQRFGTQFDFDKSGRLILHPVKNLKIVDRLRKEYNLPPLGDFMKMADEFNAKLENRKGRKFYK